MRGLFNTYISHMVALVANSISIGSICSAWCLASSIQLFIAKSMAYVHQCFSFLTVGNCAAMNTNTNENACHVVNNCPTCSASSSHRLLLCNNHRGSVLASIADMIRAIFICVSGGDRQQILQPVPCMGCCHWHR